MDGFLANNSQKAMYRTKENGLIDIRTLFVKPNETEFLAILDSFRSTVYDPVTGWDESNITSMDSEGFLTHYFHTAGENAERPDNDSIITSFASRAACQTPWACYYNSEWDNMTKNECRSLNHAWYSYRQHFEDASWSKTLDFNTSESDYHIDFFLGYCTIDGFYQRLTTESNTPAPISKAPVSTAPISQAPISQAPIAPNPTAVPTSAPTTTILNFQSLSCNQNGYSECLPLASVMIMQEEGVLTIPCGSCAFLTEGSMEYEGLDIQGKLQIIEPSSAINIKTKFILVSSIISRYIPLCRRLLIRILISGPRRAGNSSFRGRCRQSKPACEYSIDGYQ